MVDCAGGARACQPNRAAAYGTTNCPRRRAARPLRVTRRRALIMTLEAQPDRAFARSVETALQQLSDDTRLEASPLVKELRLAGPTHIERGKALRQQLLLAVENLRPAAQRPDGVLP